MASDASSMLEAALEQMDDIIAGSKAVVPVDVTGRALVPLPSEDCCPSARVLQLTEELKGALDSQEDKDSLRRQVPSTTAHTLLLWLDKSLVCIVVLHHCSGKILRE
ncbi:hypothetical protein AOLI_G00094370 [Acnodon oligacanthus]